MNVERTYDSRREEGPAYTGVDKMEGAGIAAMPPPCRWSRRAPRTELHRVQGWGTETPVQCRGPSSVRGPAGCSTLDALLTNLKVLLLSTTKLVVQLAAGWDVRSTARSPHQLRHADRYRAWNWHCSGPTTLAPAPLSYQGRGGSVDFVESNGASLITNGAPAARYLPYLKFLR